MKKLLLLISNLFIGYLANSQTLTSGNIVVLRVGDSVSTLSSAGNTLALDQFTRTGAYVNSLIMPKTGTNAVCLSGTATSEGQLTLAGNRSSVVFFAYKTAPPYTAVAGSTSTAVNRAVVSINSTGAFSIPTLTATNLSGNNARHVFTNGSNYWGGGGSTGIIFGNSSINMDTIVTTSTTNTRFITNAGTQLYYSTASGTFGIWKLGNGSPTNSGTIATPYITTASSGTGNASPYAFSMKFDSSICYIADDRSIANGGGIQKWTRTGSTWSLAYTLGTGTGSTVGARGLVVDWTTTPPTIIATTAEATLNRVIRLNDTSSSVTAVTLATATSNTIFRGVAFTPGTSSLPVKLVSFTATLNNNQTELNWSTASETNNKGFEIEKSIDGVNFETIGFVTGNGNSNRINKYSFIDANQSSAYYRLKQIDFDGQFEYSSTVKVNSDELLIELNPNPFNDNLVISSASNIVSAEIIDVNGKTRIMEILNNNKASINTSSLSNGIYFIRINDGQKVITKRIIKN